MMAFTFYFVSAVGWFAFVYLVGMVVGGGEGAFKTFAE